MATVTVTVLKAFFKSIKIPLVNKRLSILDWIALNISTMISSVENPSLKPYWDENKIHVFLTLIKCSILLYITCSKTLSNIDKREIGL